MDRRPGSSLDWLDNREEEKRTKWKEGDRSLASKARV